MLLEPLSLVVPPVVPEAVSEVGSEVGPELAAAVVASDRPVVAETVVERPVVAEPVAAEPVVVDRDVDQHYVEKQVQPIAEPVLALLGLDFAAVAGEPRQLSLF